MSLAYKQNTLCIAKCFSSVVARWNYVLFGSVVVCSQAALFTVVDFFFFFPDQDAWLGRVFSVSPCD